jgi:virginiamycin A acetyltransferase
MLASLFSIIRTRKQRIEAEHLASVERSKLYTKDKIKYASYNIGEGTYGEPNIYDWGDGVPLSIGKYCSIAENVTLLLGGEHATTSVSSYPFDSICKISEGVNSNAFVIDRFSKGGIEIGHDVWIGTGVTILSGVKIGNGAIIGAGSIVVKSIPDYTIVAGNPARIIRTRFSAQQIEQLNHIAWWDWDKQQIMQASKELMDNDIELFIRKYLK